MRPTVLACCWVLGSAAVSDNAGANYTADGTRLHADLLPHAFSQALSMDSAIRPESVEDVAVGIPLSDTFVRLR